MNFKKALELDYGSIKVGEMVEFNKQITAEDVEKFATLTGDFNPLHMDSDYALTTLFGERIIHGMLLGSLFSTLVGMYLPGKNCLYLSQDLSFRLPAKIGNTFKVRGKVINKIDSLKILVIQTEILDEKGLILVEGEAKVKCL